MPNALPRLYAHPFSSYCQKVLVALYENDTPFDYRNLEDKQANAELATLWPMRRFPVLVDGDRTVLEASCIIEYLDLHHPGPVKLVPEDRDSALEARMLGRTRSTARFANVRAYRKRLLARPSFRRAVDEARPYRSYFPLGAPDRD